MRRASGGPKRGAQRVPGLPSSRGHPAGRAEPRLSRVAATTPCVLYEYVPPRRGKDRFAWVSARAREVLELEPEALERDSGLLWRMVPPAELARVAAGVEDAVRRRADFQAEFPIDTPSGQRKWLQARSRPTPSPRGRVPHWCGVLVDVSVERRTLDTLDHDRERLRRMTEEVTERTRALEELREADRRKSDFLALLSHELRNPLAPIRNALYLLGRVPAGSEQAHRAFAVVERQVGQLSRLVDDLLDVTRIARDRMPIDRRRLELNELVLRTVEDHRSTFEAAGIDLTVEPAPEALYAEGDPARLAQVLANLLHNAAKFTPSGGRTRVRVSRGGPGDARIVVKDTGAGMSPEVLSRLFQPFRQEDGDRSHGGLGLGLALVKGLVASHGGEVEARSEGPGRGSELEVRLPLLPEEALREEPRPDRRRRRILIIEDNVDSATTLRDLLELDGHDVDVAYEGGDGVARARGHRPDVVLCDLGLPGMDGYDVARALRATPGLEGMHLVAVSGYALPDDVRRAQEAGFERHLPKPASLDQIEQALEAMP